MKGILHTLFITFFIISGLMAQRPEGGAPGSATLQGVLVDSVSGSPVEFAAVALWNATKPVDGTLTSTNGKFKFEGVKAGTYKLLISFVGYKAQTVGNIQVGKNDNIKDIGEVKLVGDNIQLEELTVTGQAALVEDKIDRLVYNAEKDISNRGGTAEEVLRKVPMLSVDLDGNVELRGSQNVRVLINNKPSTIFASSIGEALKQIPSDQIKSVEVITSPSAKYDGEGTAGIVNIILKKNTLAGVTGSVSTGVGFMGSYLNGNLNLRDQKWGISLNGGGRYSYNFRTTSYNTRLSTISDVSTYLLQTSEDKGTWLRGRYQGSFDYNFDANTSLTLSYANRVRGNSSIGEQLTNLYDGTSAIDANQVSSIARYIDQSTNGNSSDIDLTFLKRFANPIQELSIMAQISSNKTINDFTATQNGVRADSSKNNGLDKEMNFQIDYVQPLGEKVKWELGAKTVLRAATTDGLFYSYNTQTNSYQQNALRSNFLDYDQNVAAGYSSFTVELPKKFGIQAGVRYEQTSINARFKENNDVEIPGYTNWLPSINLSKRFEKGGSARLSYTQRIQRPRINYLNPYIDYSNANSISYGQPTLMPELVDMLEASVSTYFGSNSLNFSLYSRIEDNSITSVSSVTRNSEGIDVIENTYANIGVNKRYGLNISYNLNPTKSWRIGGGIDPNYTYMDNRTVSNKGWNTSLNLNTSYSFPKGFAASFFGFYRSPRVQLQGISNGFYFHGLTVKKDIAKKKGSIGLSLENPLVKTIDFKNNLESRGVNAMGQSTYFMQDNLRQMYRRSIRVDFQYSFGKMDANRQGLFKRKTPRTRGNDAIDEDGGGGDMM